MVEYAATSINHFREGRDKKTPLERHRVVKHERPLAEFGEQVHYPPLDRKHNASHSPDVRYEEGIWLGLVMKSQEVIIWTPSRVVRARSIKRRPEDVRWNADEVMKIVGAPWNPTPGGEPDRLQAPLLLPADIGAVPSTAPPAEPGFVGRRTKFTAVDIK